MNKIIPTSKAIIAVVVLAGLVIGGILAYQYYWQSSEKEFVPVHGVPCSKEYWEAIDMADVTICELTIETSSAKNPYYDNHCRESCIQNIAYKKGNPQLCELINDFKDIPRVDGWTDPRETGSSRDHCYIQLSSKLDDVSLCDKVETNWAKTNCPI